MFVNVFNLSVLHVLHVRSFWRLVFCCPGASKMGARRSPKSVPGASTMTLRGVQNELPEASGGFLGVSCPAFVLLPRFLRALVMVYIGTVAILPRRQRLASLPKQDSASCSGICSRFGGTFVRSSRRE